jgi:hypothetical protein
MIDIGADPYAGPRVPLFLDSACLDSGVDGPGA